MKSKWRTTGLEIYEQIYNCQDIYQLALWITAMVFVYFNPHRGEKFFLNYKSAPASSFIQAKIGTRNGQWNKVSKPETGHLTLQIRICVPKFWTSTIHPTQDKAGKMFLTYIFLYRQFSRHHLQHRLPVFLVQIC